MADSLALLPVSGGRWDGARREPVAVQRGLPMQAAGQLLGAQGLPLLRACPRRQSARRHSSPLPSAPQPGQYGAVRLRAGRRRRTAGGSASDVQPAAAATTTRLGM